MHIDAYWAASGKGAFLNGTPMHVYSGEPLYNILGLNISGADAGLLARNVERGFDLTMEKSDLYMSEARLAIEAVPKNFTHTDFLNFLFLTVEHYNRYWYNHITKASVWSKFESNLPVRLN